MEETRQEKTYGVAFAGEEETSVWSIISRIEPGKREHQDFR